MHLFDLQKPSTTLQTISQIAPRASQRCPQTCPETFEICPQNFPQHPKRMLNIKHIKVSFGRRVVGTNIEVSCSLGGRTVLNPSSRSPNQEAHNLVVKCLFFNHTSAAWSRFDATLGQDDSYKSPASFPTLQDLGILGKPLLFWEFICFQRTIIKWEISIISFVGVITSTSNSAPPESSLFSAHSLQSPWPSPTVIKGTPAGPPAPPASGRRPLKSGTNKAGVQTEKTTKK